MERELDVAMEAAVRGAYQVVRFFGKSMEEIGLEYKPADGDTPRTIIDRESEKAILSYLKQHFQNDTFNAEESGVHAGSGKRLWHVDPYDGTSNAAINLDLSTVGIALQKGDEVVVGVAVDPFRKIAYVAEKGSGAFAVPYYEHEDGPTFEVAKRLKVSQRKQPKERYAEIDGLFNAKTTARKTGFMAALAQYAQNYRMTGSNIRSSMSLAAGNTDIWLIDAVGGFFDIAPGAVLIPEAGGRITDLHGNIPKPGAQVALATNNVGDHDAIEALARKYYEGYAGFR